LVCVAVGLTGCGLAGRSDDTGGTGGPDEVVPADAPTGTCASDLDEDALADQMALFVAIRETVQDVGTSATAERDARERLAELPKNLLLHPTRVQLPVGLEWGGDGVYFADSGNVVFDVLAQWDGGLQDGVPIKHDLFNPNNYFTGLLVTTDASRGTVTLRFREKGPLADLLGFGTLASGDSVPLSALQDPLTGLSLAFEATLDADYEGAVVVGSLEGAPVAPGQARQTTSLPTLRGRNTARGQRIVVAPLTLTEDDEAVVATTSFEVQGDTLSYTGEVEVTDGVLTTAESRCPRD
jgi:hypothetical protein